MKTKCPVFYLCFTLLRTVTGGHKINLRGRTQNKAGSSREISHLHHCHHHHHRCHFIQICRNNRTPKSQLYLFTRPLAAKYSSFHLLLKKRCGEDALTIMSINDPVCSKGVDLYYVLLFLSVFSCVISGQCSLCRVSILFVFTFDSSS